MARNSKIAETVRIAFRLAELNALNIQSGDGSETGLLVCPPEKKAAKLAGSNEQDTFSGPL